MLRRTIAPLAAAVALALPAGASAAGDPTMPLSEVHAGQRCFAYTVVRGTDIASFDVDVLDVIAGDGAQAQPYILFRASGPAVDDTGIAEGFSGSPIYCPGADGNPRVIGAISQGIGEYGNLTALATPIESVLGQPVDPPADTRRAPSIIRAAKPLATPLSVGGLAPKVASIVEHAGARAGRVVYAAPSAPLAKPFFPVQTLRPGASLAVGLASGSVTAGAVGTVTYVDGNRVWGFGHPLDGVGRRSLLLQDAYVYDVVNNPIGSGDLVSYKYAVSGHDLGTLSGDGNAAVAGTLGTAPPSFPLVITSKDLDSGKITQANIKIADETALGQPTGVSSLTQVGSMAVLESIYATLGGLPLRQSGQMCVKIAVKELPVPMQFCNSYVGGTGSSDDSGGPIVGDFAAAASALDAYNFGPLHVTGVTVNLKLRRSLRLAYLLGITKAPAHVKRGRTATISVLAQRQNGPRFTRRIRVRIPRSTKPGERTLTLRGAAADGGGASSALDALTTVLDLGDVSGDAADAQDPGPRTPADLAIAVAAIHRDTAVTASLRRASDARPVFRDPDFRLSGKAERRIRVTR